MGQGIDIGDRVALTATVKQRIDDRATLHIPTANFPYSIIDAKAKAGDKIRFEGEVIYVDEDTGRATVEVLGRITVDADTLELVSKYQPPEGTSPLRNKPA